MRASAASAASAAASDASAAQPERPLAYSQHSTESADCVTSAFMSLHDMANRAANAGGHMAMEIGTTAAAPRACNGPPAGAPPPAWHVASVGRTPPITRQPGLLGMSLQVLGYTAS